MSSTADFGRLLIDHAEHIEAVVHRCADDAMERDDLRQEIAIAIWRALPGFADVRPSARTSCASPTIGPQRLASRARALAPCSRRSPETLPQSDRASRLHALKDTVLIEVALLFAWPLVTTAFAGGVLRWGVGFTIAFCALAVIWPLQRIAEAQPTEGERLQGLVDLDAA